MFIVYVLPLLLQQNTALLNIMIEISQLNLKHQLGVNLYNIGEGIETYTIGQK